MRFLFIYCFLFIGFLAISQASIKVGVSKLVLQEGEKFTYEIIMNQNCELDLPKFKGVQVAAGPMVGQSSSYSNYNGNASQSTTYSYTYTLQALKKGKYTIGAPKMTCGKETIYGDKITIEVVDSDQLNNISPDAIQNYIKLTSTKEKVYVGEPFILTTTFYSVEQPSSIEVITQGTAENLKREEITLNRVVSANQSYYQVDLSREVAYGTKEGTVQIMPYTGVLQKEIDFFNVKRLEGISNKLEIEVLPLPNGAPEYFKGLVGDIELMYDISKTNVNVGEAIDLDITIKGVGNFDQMGEPMLELPEGFFVHDPEIFTDTKATPKGIQGEVRYKFAIVPEEAGEFDVQPFALAFFNYNTEKYELVGTDKMTITVNSGNEDYGKVYKNRVEKSYSGQTSLSGVTEEHKINSKENELFGGLLHVGGSISPLLLISAFLLYKRSRANLSEEQLLRGKRRSAANTAIKQIQQINLIESNASQKLKGVLEDFMMVKLGLSRANITEVSLLTAIESKGVSEELKGKFKSLWNKLEMSAYAPIAQSDLSGVAHEVKVLINDLNRVV